MADNKQNLSTNLFNLLVSKDFEVKTLNSQGKEEANLEEVEMFSFDFEEGGKNFGTVVILLNSTGQLEIFYADAMGKTMNYNERKVWSDLLYQLRMYAKRNMLGFQVQNINRLKYSMQSMASLSESFENIFESYYGTSKTSYSPQGKAKIIIKHSKKLGEEDKRYRNISSIFIQNEGGERFKLPFKKLNGARAMARHVTEGGNPYDLFGLHITEMVKDIGTLGSFMRRSKIFTEDEATSSLVETGRTHYSGMRKGLKQIAGKRGYHTYKESWKPSEITETEIDVESIRKLFTEKAINPSIDNALPLLARLSETMPDVVLDDVTPSKELSEFDNWASDLIDEATSEEEKAANREWNARPDVAGIQDSGGYETTNWTGDKVKSLQDFFSEEQPVGINALNATEILYDLIDDEELFNELGVLAERDPDADSREVVANWISNNEPQIADELNLHGEYDNPAARDFSREGLGEEKDLDSDEQCLNASKDDKLTDKGEGMDPFKDYVQEAEAGTQTDLTQVPVKDTPQDPGLVAMEDENDLSSLMQRTNYLLQK